jgi:hypothetical protein
MHFTKLVALLSASFTVPVLALQGFAYPCTDCRCNGATVLDIGPNTRSGCVNINTGFGPVAIGLSGSSHDKCTLFKTGDCKGINQAVGIHSGQTWGCTGTQIGGNFGSISCVSG